MSPRCGEKLSELANQRGRTRVSVCGEVKTQDPSMPEPAAEERPIRAPSESRTRSRRPCGTTWLQGRVTPSSVHPLACRSTNVQVVGPFPEGASTCPYRDIL